MFQGGFYDQDDPMDGVFHPGLMHRAGHTPRRFDEYYRCYPVAMIPGPERENANHGGKVFLPPSALDKLTRLHITYPMLFEVHNGAKQRFTHAGVLEFIAEEGKIYLPFWMMQTLLLEPGDLIQIKSTDLPLGRLIKLQAQSTSFLDISDPKAVLENAFRNFSCLTKGDIFTFSYNDQTYEMAVLETKPENPENAISVLETDLEVDFAPPLGYEEPKKPSGTSTPSSPINSNLPHGGMLHPHGSMAQSINYAAIAPESTTVAQGEKTVSSNFLQGGQRLNAKKGNKQPTPKASTPASDASTNVQPPAPVRRNNGPQPLRLPPGKLFFGYEIKPVQKRAEEGDKEGQSKTKFSGAGQSLRGAKKK
ncbi:ubiquitin fusion degradation protein [Ophidiomyces ophidiicola]|nr:ubiquitin fusion degradation protein [Ophidiomyces ophidiicola]KAI1926783.1 ubiquitin fusion degradation protein [Ophidiomyces ophidiicola]KAI2142821.1 ubiquitin fusion degradation protein [Ophidiomyces ophidiicola]KAI2260140.1 ubiquitin fusion degradation protein [Ophidiomyces ophidiicola]KAI2404896.1 ubiquitin fusion degradation protein [Ophidiomyces ophidiicola]